MKRLFAALLLTLAGCSQNHDADVKALRDDEAQWVKDYNSKDPDRIASHYAADAVIMNPGGAAVHGRDAARASYRGMAGDPAFSLAMDPERVELSRSGELGYVHGPYSMTRTDRSTGEKMMEKGSFLTIYKRQADGAWKVVADMATVEKLAPLTDR